MRRLAIPASDHVSRYCKPSTIDNDLPIAAAFLPRPNEESLSVNWLEFLSKNDLTRSLQKVRSRFRSRSYQLRRNGRFVVANVGQCKEAATHVQGQIEFRHLPLPSDDSHAGIFGISEDDLALATEISRLVSKADVHPAID